MSVGKILNYIPQNPNLLRSFPRQTQHVRTYVLETRLAERTSFQQTSASRQRSRSRLGSHMYFRQRVIIAPLITSDANNQVYEKFTRRPT